MSILNYIATFPQSSNSSSSGGGETPPPDPTQIGEFISDTFPGTSLSGNWTKTGGHTVAVASNKVRLQGVGTTRDGITQRHDYTGYVKSTLRAFVIESNINFNTATSHDYGPYLAVRSYAALSFNTSFCGLVDVAENKLQLFGCNGSDLFNALATEATLTVSPNTSDDFYMKLTVTGTTASLFFKNLTTTASQTLNYTFDFTTSANPFKPNIFRYSFGVVGNSDVSFSAYKVSSTEHVNPVGIFIGDSITVRYMAGTSKGYAELLQDVTTDIWDIHAGGGMATADIIDALDEIIALAPQKVIIHAGTNDNGDFTTGWTNLQTINNTLVAAGIETYFLLIPNGGDPASSGGYNNHIATTYSSKYSDTWTGGYTNMADSVHPNAAGHTDLKNKVSTDKPTWFPL
jgi:hypothetical protein